MVTMILTSRRAQSYSGFPRKSTHKIPVKISAFVAWIFSDIFSDLFSDLFSDDNAKTPHDFRQKNYPLFLTYRYPHLSTPICPHC
jgi:hypothetical protein